MLLFTLFYLAEKLKHFHEGKKKPSWKCSPLWGLA